MGISAEKKLRAEKVIAVFRQSLAAAHGKDVEWTRRYRAGDESAMEELVHRACTEGNMSPGEYQEAIDSDAQLHELHRRCIAEVMLGVMHRAEE